MQFDSSYLSLPPVFYHRQPPVPVRDPKLVCFNQAFAEALGLHTAADGPGTWAMWLGGNQLPPGASPIAQAYAGHQFGHFTMLGDGRAILLGEILDGEGRRFDLQLKGAGSTPFSRRGDGRATLSSMLREYLISEAMHHLGIPTSRSLAVVSTGEPVYRERVHEGAVLSRVAASHVRVGTFEYARSFCSHEDLQALADYVIKRHYPALVGLEDRVFLLLEAVMDRQLDLIVHWMRVGFIHGVMNTDNMAISGETIDYGPCAFMNVYRPETVFSSIDTQGRYAYAQQPRIAQWNLAVLAGTLLPLMPGPEEALVCRLEELLKSFPDRYLERWQRMMRRKLGLLEARSEDRDIIDGLLLWMTETRADWTDTFLALESDDPELQFFKVGQDRPDWFRVWQERVKGQPGSTMVAKALMARENPTRIPRNHLIEQALEEAVQGDLSRFLVYTNRLARPYDRIRESLDTDKVPMGFDDDYRTFCGT